MDTKLSLALQNAQAIVDDLRFDHATNQLDWSRLQKVFPAGVIEDQNHRIINIHVIHLLNLALKNIQELNTKVHDLEMQLLLR